MSKYSSNIDVTKPYDPQGLRRHIDSFIMLLAEHLRDEIDTLRPELIEKIGEKNDREIRKNVQAHLQSYDPKWFLCSAFSV
jgi:hypothetical protein